MLAPYQYLLASGLAVLGASIVALAQTACANYGTTDGSSCSCPPGFGGRNCSTPACGGTIFQGARRPLVQTSGSTFANLSASNCACDDGWTGAGCNVCQTARACATAFASVSSSASGLTGSADGQNDTMTCNTLPRVYAAGEMSCSVVNPSLQALFPGPSSLNILRTLQSSLTPLPNVTAFGASGTISAQLLYSGVEQFYCTANNCTQNLDASGGEVDWACQNLQCTCIPGTSFCGAVALSDLTSVINGLAGELDIKCTTNTTSTACSFVQSTLKNLFGPAGLGLASCSFGECVQQDVIDTSSTNSTSMTDVGGRELGAGVIAGLAVVGALVVLVGLLLLLGWVSQKKARRGGEMEKGGGGFAVEWAGLSYAVPGIADGLASSLRLRRRKVQDNVILDTVSGRVESGQMMAVLGPSGAGKTTLVEILAGKHKLGQTTGSVLFPHSTSTTTVPKVGFVPQQDILPAMLTVRETLLFAARLRLPEGVPYAQKAERVEEVMHMLDIAHLGDVRVGSVERRGISGGEMRRVSIGVELVARPDVIILDEPTSGLDSVSAIKVASALRAIAHDPTVPTTVIASIHQPSPRLYQTFDRVLLLAHGRTLYNGAGGQAPLSYFEQHGRRCEHGYNAADFLLEVASEAPLELFQVGGQSGGAGFGRPSEGYGLSSASGADLAEKGEGEVRSAMPTAPLGSIPDGRQEMSRAYGATFLTQLEVLCGREWKILRRDKTLFLTHFAVGAVLGVFCGGLYYRTGLTIAGFQSRIGCLFFLGALVAFSSLSALYNIVEMRPLFLRERSASYYSPAAWLLSRLIFDVVPLRLIPTIVVSTITYWMAGLAPDAAHFFKFLFILVLYSLAMTLFNFLLACIFRNGGIAILLSALTGLYQMTYAGFFVHLNSIPPVLRWLQWLCPLKYALEALSVNEVGSGLMIQDSLEGVPVDVSASLIMNLLFGFGDNNYYRDVLVLFAFIAGFAVSVILVVWFNVKERR